jgi:uncharacterized protein (TIGR02284 family)
METQKTAAAVNDLIIINNDRYEGYNTALTETRDADLKTLFPEYANQSKKFAEELKKHVPASKETADSDDTKATGKIYRVWMNFKSAVTDHDRKAILSSCEFGEDAAKKTYDEVLEHSNDLPKEVMDIIRRQRMELQKGHDTIKSLRDSIA